MHNDEKAIRDWGDSWLAASKKGDLATARDLMADDVVFMVPGKEPFGKDAFTVSSRETTGVLVDGTSDIQEIKVHGDWAWMRNRLKVTIRPPNGKSVVHSGYTLTILQKKPGREMGDNPRRESTDTARQDMNIITNPSDYGRRSADDKSRVVS